MDTFASFIAAQGGADLHQEPSECWQSQEKQEDNVPSSSCCRRGASSMSRNKYLSDGLSSHMVLILAVM